MGENMSKELFRELHGIKENEETVRKALEEIDKEAVALAEKEVEEETKTLDEVVEEILEKAGFRKISDREIVEDDYWRKTQEVFLKNSELWNWKWKKIGNITIRLPSGYLSYCGADVYVNAPINDEPKLVIAYWNRYETGMPKSEYYYVRKDLEYIIIRSCGTPEKIAVNGLWEGTERGEVTVYAVKNGKIVYSKQLKYGPYSYYFKEVEWSKIVDFVKEALKTLGK